MYWCCYAGVVLVGNKTDLRVAGKGVSSEEVRKYMSKKNKWQYIECSAKNNLNIKEIFRLVAKMLR